MKSPTGGSSGDFPDQKVPLGKGVKMLDAG